MKDCNVSSVSRGSSTTAGALQGRFAAAADDVVFSSFFSIMTPSSAQPQHEIPRAPARGEEDVIVEGFTGEAALPLLGATRGRAVQEGDGADRLHQRRRAGATARATV